jgi:hypothetical protein
MREIPPVMKFQITDLTDRIIRPFLYPVSGFELPDIRPDNGYRTENSRISGPNRKRTIIVSRDAPDTVSAGYPAGRISG